MTRTTRRDTFAVGLSILGVLALVVVAWLFLGSVGPRGPNTLHTARFRTLGGVSIGDPVVLRGVRVGRVEAIRLAPDDWVEADLRVANPADVPARAVAIATSASLFGEWQVAVMDAARAPQDPDVQAALAEAGEGAGAVWPGATLPDIGQLTAQASRIASDIAQVTNRVQAAVDSQAIADISASVRDLRDMATRLLAFTQAQTGSLEQVVGNATASSADVAKAARHLELTLSRIDSSTASGELAAMVRDARATAAGLREASEDLRLLAGTAKDQREKLVAIVSGADAMVSRLARGEGTLGMLMADSALYRESTRAVVQLRQLLEDIQANPRRYFRFSVF